MKIAFGIRLTQNQQQNIINDDELNRTKKRQLEKCESGMGAKIKKGRKGCVGNWYVRCKSGSFVDNINKRERKRVCNARITKSNNKKRMKERMKFQIVVRIVLFNGGCVDILKIIASFSMHVRQVASVN